MSTGTLASARELGRAIAARETTAREQLELHLARISEVNPRLNAIVTLCEVEAREAAAASDLRMERGEALGPLDGVPFVVKDVLATAGVRSTAGSLLLEDFVPSHDATAVARLKASGCVMLGKSNCPEFALDPHTDNRLFGLTRNPLNEEYTAGGSSGGDAAAVASGCAAFGIGSDYGGSIRWPAQCTGIAGIRPTVGLVPGTGALPFPVGEELPAPNSVALFSRLQTIGPLARTVGDLWEVLRLIAGPDGIDSNTVPVPLGDPASVDPTGLPCAWMDGEGNETVHPELVAGVERAASCLARLGLTVERRRPPGFERAIGIYRAFRVADGLPVHAAIARGHEDRLAETMRHWFATVRPSVSVEEYQGHAAQRDVLRRSALEFMEAWPILLLPVSLVPPYRAGAVEFAERFRYMAPCWAVTLLGLPAVVVRVGTTSDGLPVGVQVVARPFADHEAVAVAAALEAGLAGG